jgi:hypothetical protein
MPQHTRRLASDAGQPQQWLIWYDGINVGQIRERHGAPFGSDAWEWFCGFYPGSQPGEQRMGAAGTYEAARDAFNRAWTVYLTKRTPADFCTWRHHHAWTEAKYRAWDTGTPLPPWPLPGFDQLDVKRDIGPLGRRS